MRHVPQRMCVACRLTGDKKEFIRVVRTEEGQILIDMLGRLPGRGAYVCLNSICIENALKRKHFERVLKSTLSPEAVEALRARGAKEVK